MRFVLLALSLILLACMGMASCIANNTYENAVSGHLKRAADAQTVEMAREELAIAVHSLEARGATSGYTSLFYRTPDEDVGFWYRNLNASLAELTTLPAAATLLERSNILMRLRSTLMHHGDKGETVNEPGGISVYPNQQIFCWIWILGAILALGSWFWIEESR